MSECRIDFQFPGVEVVVEAASVLIMILWIKSVLLSCCSLRYLDGCSNVLRRVE